MNLTWHSKPTLSRQFSKHCYRQTSASTLVTRTINIHVGLSLQDDHADHCVRTAGSIFNPELQTHKEGSVQLIKCGCMHLSMSIHRQNSCPHHFLSPVLHMRPKIHSALYKRKPLFMGLGFSLITSIKEDYILGWRQASLGTTSVLS